MPARKKDAALACVVLAAGLGTRMKSSVPKVLHGLFGSPVLQYTLNALHGLRPERIVVVTGRNAKEISEAVEAPASTVFAVQQEQRGTAHALSAALPALKSLKKSATVLVVNGDTPLITTATLKKFVARHRRSGKDLSLISFMTDDPGAYGRIIRDSDGARIVEHPDATEEELCVNEVNSGVYALEPRAMALLKVIGLNKKKKEFYLTDIMGLAASRKGFSSGVYCLGAESEFMGINTREDLAVAIEAIRVRSIIKWLGRGVTFIDPLSVFIGPEVRIGRDTVLYPNVHLEGTTRIATGCTVYPNTRIVDSTIKKGAVIKDTTLIEESTVGAGAAVGPFAHIRPGSNIGPGAKVGNFVEIKKSDLGRGTKAMHLSYIGDATVGSNVNIGAGTITCNYDGRKKSRTMIEDNVFIGSDTQLVAPVRVGKGSYVGAGTTLTRDVPADSLAVSRARQKNIKRSRRGGRKG